MSSVLERIFGRKSQPTAPKEETLVSQLEQAQTELATLQQRRNQLIGDMTREGTPADVELLERLNRQIDGLKEKVAGLKSLVV